MEKGVKIDQSATDKRDIIHQQSGNDMNLISPNLADNQQRIEDIFANCHDISILHWGYGPELKYTAFSVYCNTLVQVKQLNYMKESLQDLVTHEVGPATMVTPEDVISFFNQQGVSSQSANLLEGFDQAVTDILNGNVVIFFNQWNKVLSYKAISIEGRQVAEPVTEAVVQGPREGTVESLEKNIGLLRLRLKSPRFKIEFITAGEETKTKIAFGYLEKVVNPEMLDEFKKRIANIDKEEVLETSYVEGLIEDSTYSPFPQFRYTERPDAAVAALLEGKIVVLVQGTGSILICPGLFTEFFHSSEDYYQRTIFATAIRQLRIGAFLLALILPSAYIALSTFHPELIPSVLLLAVLNTREGVPFPAFIEAVLMEVLFELLREAGIRLPRPVGSAVSIVGALVIGEAAINAGLASPIMVVIVAMTGIASFSIPQYNIGIALRILRMPLMLLAAILGGFGIMIGLLWILLHMTNLRVLGQPYLTPLAPLHPGQWRDVFIRAPLKNLTRAPRNRHLHKTSKN